MIRLRALLLVPPLLALAACATVTSDDRIAESSDPSERPDRWHCGFAPIDFERLDEAPDLGSLSAAGREALFAPDLNVDGEEGWVVLRDEPVFVEIAREFDEPFWWAEELRTHDRIELRKIGADGMADSPPEVWMQMSRTSCAIRIDPGEGADAASVFLDPANPAAAGDTSIDLLVMEHSCANGQPATGRISTSEQQESADRIELVIVTERLETATCPSHRPTPHTIDLDEPLGDRIVMDASYLEPIVAPIYDPAVVSPLDYPG